MCLGIYGEILNKLMNMILYFLVMAYMEMFGNAQNVQFHPSSDSSSMLMRHSMHTFSQQTTISSNENLEPKYEKNNLKFL